MRMWIVMGLLASSVGLAACQPSKPEVAEASAAPTYVGRPQQKYQGQEQLVKVTAATVERGANPGELVLKVTADAPSPGYTNLGFLPRIYAAPPKDGVYEVDVVGDKPAEPAAAVVTPVEVTGGWSRYSDDRVKGIRFITATNDVVAMVPPAG